MPYWDGRDRNSSSCRLGRCQNFSIAIGRKVWHLHAVACQSSHRDTTTKAFLHVKQGVALARWVFVNACSIIKANEYVRKEFKQCPEGFDKCIKNGRDMFDTFLSQADVAKLS